MPDAVDLGFGGLEARPGTHICGIYAGQRQHDEIVLPFLEAGLRPGTSACASWTPSSRRRS